MLGNTNLERCFEENNLGVLLDTKVNVIRQCVLATKKASGTMGCIGHISCRSRSPLLSITRPELECCVQLWIPQNKRDMDIRERAQRRSAKEMKGLECHTCEEKLRDRAVQPGVKKTQGNLLSVCKYLEGR